MDLLQEPVGGDTRRIDAAIQVAVEDDPRILEQAEKDRAVYIGFVCPYVGMRVSPSEIVNPTIGMIDEFGVERVIDTILSTCKKDVPLHLLVNSPGGGVSSSYKVARALRTSFRHITTFVPHVAASGGTLVAIAGNEIVMGLMSQLSPVDIQIEYKGTMISSTVFMRSFARISRWFEKKREDEAPYPQRSLADKLDPYVMEEWSGSCAVGLSYLEDILKLASYKEGDAKRIAEKLTFGFGRHSEVIHAETAASVGLRVIPSEKKKRTWETMRYWLGTYALQENPFHIIRYAIPESAKKGSGGKRNKGGKRSTAPMKAQKTKGAARAQRGSDTGK